MMDGQLSSTHLRHADYTYIDEQNEERTEHLRSKVNQLKYIAVEIREETKRQNDDLTV